MRNEHHFSINLDYEGIFCRVRGLIYGAGSQVSAGIQKVYLEIPACLRPQMKEMHSISFSGLLASH